MNEETLQSSPISSDSPAIPCDEGYPELSPTSDHDNLAKPSGSARERLSLARRDADGGSGLPSESVRISEPVNDLPSRPNIDSPTVATLAQAAFVPRSHQAPSTASKSMGKSSRKKKNNLKMTAQNGYPRAEPKEYLVSKVTHVLRSTKVPNEFRNELAQLLGAWGHPVEGWKSRPADLQSSVGLPPSSLAVLQTDAMQTCVLAGLHTDLLHRNHLLNAAMAEYHSLRTEISQLSACVSNGVPM